MEEKQFFISSCPICGRTLFKGTPNSYIEGACPKCKEYLKIHFNGTGYQVCILRQEKGIVASSENKTN